MDTHVSIDRYRYMFLFFLYLCICVYKYVRIYIYAYAFAKVHGGSQWVYCKWLNGTHFKIVRLIFNNGSTKGLHGLIYIYSILMYNQETSVS